jgi:hypothetical protein
LQNLLSPAASLAPSSPLLSASAEAPFSFHFLMTQGLIFSFVEYMKMDDIFLLFPFLFPLSLGVLSFSRSFL